MKKNAIIYLAITAMIMLFTACGSDDPEIPRDRDVTMTVTALTHIKNATTNEATVTTGDNNKFVFHPKTLTLDMQLEVPLTDGFIRTYAITGVPVKAVADTYRYTFDQATCSNAAVTNLEGTIDIADPLAIMQCDIDGYHVCITVPEIFFHQTAVSFDYSDDSKSSYGNSYWNFTVNKAKMTADLSINNIEIAKDLMIVDGERKRSGRYFSAIIGHGAELTVTPTGLKITAGELSTVATYGNGEQVAAAYQTENYPIVNLTTDIDLTTGTMHTSMTLRHILARDEMNHATEWDDITVKASGTIFRQPIFN